MRPRTDEQAQAATERAEAAACTAAAERDQAEALAAALQACEEVGRAEVAALEAEDIARLSLVECTRSPPREPKPACRGPCSAISPRRKGRELLKSPRRAAVVRIYESDGGENV
ncbi:hypothetical protein [Streptomyces sp. NPDC001809]